MCSSDLGHTTVGNWSLGQICSHPTRSLTWTVEGFPKLAPWVVRKTIGPMILSRIHLSSNPTCRNTVAWSQ